MKNFTLIISLAVLLFTGCNKLFVDENPDNTPINNFDLLWSQMDERYAYFEEKGVDWDAVREKYRPQVRNNMADEELFGVLAQMLGELRDGHVNIISPFDVSRYWDWYQDYPRNFNYNIIDSVYLGKGFSMSGGMSAQVYREMGYMYYSSFMDPISSKGMEYLIDVKFKNCKGFIIDLRNNGGGLVDNIFTLGAYLVSEKTHVGYSYFKAGKEHNDFSKYFEEHFAPNDHRFGKPVVILTNRQSFSAANIFPGMSKGLPGVTLMGDNTGGGGASPSSITLLNGWEVRISSIGYSATDKSTFEFGVEPDIRVCLSSLDEGRGVDSIIEAAVEYLSR